MHLLHFATPPEEECQHAQNPRAIVINWQRQQLKEAHYYYISTATITMILLRRSTAAPPTFLVAMMLVASTMRTHAFQLAHKNSPLLVPNNIRIPPNKLFASPASSSNLNNLLVPPSLGDRSAATATMLRASSTDNDENDTNENTNNNKQVMIQNLGTSMKQFLSTHFMTLAIFLLPLFLSANDAWAVQSGGRMGGSFGGSSSSRTYSAPSSGYSRGYSRGYSSGYYSRPNVIVSPGISPFYR